MLSFHNANASIGKISILRGFASLTFVIERGAVAVWSLDDKKETA
jgi:hypothetical protein